MEALLRIGFKLIPYIADVLLIAITIWTVKEITATSIQQKWVQARFRSRLRKNRSKQKSKPIYERKGFYKHVFFVIKSNREKADESDVFIFFLISGLMAIFMFSLVVVKFHDAFLGVVIGLFTGSLPYLILQIRLRNLRKTVGNKLTSIVQTLVQTYNASNYDMYQGLHLMLATIKDEDLKRVFTRLISDLQTSRNEEEMRMSIDLFIYTAGNSWAKRLGIIILKSYIYQENVMNTLLTLSEQMKNTEMMLEQEKSGATDASLEGYLAVVLFPASLAMGHWATKPQDWVKLQFGQNWTLLLFIFALILTVASLMIVLILRNPKNDL